MGRGKSWDVHENGALAEAWVDAWRTLGEGVETGSRMFSRAVHEKFSLATPPNNLPGRYSARSEQACKQHFADLAADVRRAGAIQPNANSPILQAWSILRAVPRFRADSMPKMETDDDDEEDHISQDDDERDDDDDNNDGDNDTSQGRTQTRPRKRMKKSPPLIAPTSPTSLPETPGLDGALRLLANALMKLVETHGERNALVAFSERACTDESAVRDRAEYLSIIRRTYLHKARSNEQKFNVNVQRAASQQQQQQHTPHTSHPSMQVISPTSTSVQPPHPHSQDIDSAGGSSPDSNLPPRASQALEVFPSGV